MSGQAMQLQQVMSFFKVDTAGAVRAAAPALHSAGAKDSPVLPTAAKAAPKKAGVGDFIRY